MYTRYDILIFKGIIYGTLSSLLKSYSETCHRTLHLTSALNRSQRWTCMELLPYGIWV